jgi:hypothetical protein
LVEAKDVDSTVLAVTFPGVANLVAGMVAEVIAGIKTLYDRLLVVFAGPMAPFEHTRATAGTKHGSDICVVGGRVDGEGYQQR